MARSPFYYIRVLLISVVGFQIIEDSTLDGAPLGVLIPLSALLITVMDVLLSLIRFYHVEANYPYNKAFSYIYAILFILLCIYTTRILLIVIILSYTKFSLYSNLRWEDGGNFLCWTGLVAVIATIIIGEGGRLWTIGDWICAQVGKIDLWTRILISGQRAALGRWIKEELSTMLARLFADANPAGRYYGARLPVVVDN